MEENSSNANDEQPDEQDAASSEEEALTRDLSLEEESFDPSNTASLQKRIKELETESSQNHEKYLRALADLENLRDRTRRERADLLKYQGEGIVVEIVGALDNLDLALQHADADPATILQGMQMVHKQFVDALETYSIRAESSVGKSFDPNKHNAISKEVDAEAESGSVIRELKKAYFYKDKLIRAAEVVVAVSEQEVPKPESAAEESSEAEESADSTKDEPVQ